MRVNKRPFTVVRVEPKGQPFRTITKLNMKKEVKRTCFACNGRREISGVSCPWCVEEAKG